MYLYWTEAVPWPDWKAIPSAVLIPCFKSRKRWRAKHWLPQCSLTDRQYFVRGSTALLEAIGRTISSMAATQQQMPESLRAEKVIFVITTDGLENASQEYSYDLLRSMIQKQNEAWGWEFLFLGTNMDAVAEAAKFGIVKERAVTYQNDSRGIQLNYQAVGAFLHEARVCSQPAGASWKAKIEQDVKARGRKKR